MPCYRPCSCLFHSPCRVIDPIAAGSLTMPCYRLRCCWHHSLCRVTDPIAAGVTHYAVLQTPSLTVAERGTANDPIIWLDRLSAIFRHLDPQVARGEDHPCREVVMQVGNSSPQWRVINKFKFRTYHCTVGYLLQVRQSPQ